MLTNLSNESKTALQVIFVLAIIGASIAILLSLGVTRTTSENRLVYFEVKASGGYAIISLREGDEFIKKSATETMPWSRTLRIKSGTEVYLTASNPSQTGELSCRITLDKVAWKLEKINAPKDGVACAGIVP